MDLTRRSLLVVSATGLLSGCSGGGDPAGSPSARATSAFSGVPSSAPTSSGPNIVRPDAGTVLLPEDVTALTRQLSQATSSGEVGRLMDLLPADAILREDLEKWWARRLDGMRRIGGITTQWYLQVPSGRTRNGSGGPVEVDVVFAFGHRIPGCDAQMVVEQVHGSIRKAGPEASIELLGLSTTPDDRVTPAVWDVSPIRALHTDHTVIVFRPQDAAVAKARAAEIEEGARRAFAAMPRPRGVSKVFYALTWPEVDGKLWGGVSTADADAHAYHHHFLNPDDLAKGNRVAAGRRGMPLSTGRVGLHQAALGRPDFIELCTHEAVHVLAEQWAGLPDEPPTWVVEGLATWAATGDELASWRSQARTHWAAFTDVAGRGPEQYELFHHSPLESVFYRCGALVFAWLEATEGRQAALDVARAYYGSGYREEAEQAMGRTQAELLAGTRSWLG